MAISDYSTTPASNTAINGINISSTGLVSQGDDAIRQLMADIKAGVPYLSGSTVIFPAGALVPPSNDGAAIGTTTLMWSDLFLASGAVVNFNNGDVTLTHSSNALAVAGATTYTFDAPIKPTSAGASVAVVAGHLYGLTLSNNTGDATNDIDIAAGEAVDGAITDLMRLTSGLTKRLDAAWAVGSGNGGLDTGSIANGTYHLWLIKRPDTGVVDVLFSISATAPTMPTNYTLKRRIGSVLRESGALVAFVQDGDRFMRGAPVQDVGGTDPGTSAVTRTLSVPVGVKVVAIITAQVFNGGTVSNSWYLSDLAQPDTAAGISVYSVRTQGSSSGLSVSYLEITTNTSAQIRSRMQSSGSGQGFAILTNGWVDTRGRLAA